jgi:hypothetical protein
VAVKCCDNEQELIGYLRLLITPWRFNVQTKNDTAATGTGESEYGCFKEFATSVLAIPRSKVMPEQAVARLEAEKK